MNLREAVERTLQRRTAAIRAIVARTPSPPTDPLPTATGTPVPAAADVDRRQELLDRVRRLHWEGLSLRRITRELNLHYRIIYQTFFGIRDVIGPLSRTARTAVLPFQYRKLPTAERVVVECCPSSVLKALNLPHQNDKQPTGGPLTRHRLLAALQEFVDIPATFRRAMMRNPGGDALDAVIAAVGAWRAVLSADHTAIANHPPYKREGRLYV